MEISSTNEEAIFVPPQILDLAAVTAVYSMNMYECTCMDLRIYIYIDHMVSIDTKYFCVCHQENYMYMYTY